MKKIKNGLRAPLLERVDGALVHNAVQSALALMEMDRPSGLWCKVCDRDDCQVGRHAILPAADLSDFAIADEVAIWTRSGVRTVRVQDMKPQYVALTLAP